MANRESKALRVIRKVEELTLTEGPLAGKPFRLDGWQKKFIKGAFKRGVRQASLSVARGGGKTCLAAGLACASAPGGPLHVPRGQTIIAAAGHRQAGICFDHVLAFTRARIDRDGLRLRGTKGRWGVRRCPARLELEDHETGWRCVAVPLNPETAHGLAPTLIIADEVAQWQSQQAQQMWNALRTSQGKQKDCLMLSISTFPSDPQNPMRKLLEHPPEDAYVQIHRAEDNQLTEANLKLANPSWRERPELWRAVRSEMEEARRESYPSGFLAYRMNRGALENQRDFLIPMSIWEGLDRDAPAEGDCFWGIDLGGGTAMSAAAAYWPDTGRLDAVAMVGGAVSLEERAVNDSVPVEDYALMRDRGELIEVPGVNMPPASALFTLALGRWGRPVALAADMYRKAEHHDGLAAAGVPVLPSFRGMGAKDGAEDVHEFQTAVLNGRVRPRENFLLDRALSCAMVRHTVTAQQVAVKTPGVPDDAAVAATLAVSLGERRVRAANAHARTGNPFMAVGLS